MGLYINPPGEDKETFLARECREITPEEFIAWDFSNTEEMPIAWVQRSSFTAAGIGFQAREHGLWVAQMNDGDPQKFYACPTHLLRDASVSGVDAHSFEAMMSRGLVVPQS
jgi:hypothetical protein